MAGADEGYRRCLKVRLPIGASAQHGVAADRFAREIEAFWEAFASALAAAERQAVGPRYHCDLNNHSWLPLALTFLHKVSTRGLPGTYLYHMHQEGAACVSAPSVWVGDCPGLQFPDLAHCSSLTGSVSSRT